MEAIARSRFLAGVLLALIMFAMPYEVRSEEISIAGGPVSVENIINPLKEPFKLATGVTLDIRNLNYKFAIPQLMQRSLDLFVTILPMKEVYRDLKAAKISIPDTSGIQTFDIAQMPLSVVVHKKNGVSSLSWKDLKAIFTGKISNWKDVGGPDAPITVVEPPSAAVAAAVRYQVMDGEPFHAGKSRWGSVEETGKKLAAASGAITVLPKMFVTESVKEIAVPEIIQTTICVSNGEPSAQALKFINFAKGEGQKYLMPVVIPSRQKK